MKKCVSMILAAACALSLAACGSGIEATKEPFPEFTGMDFSGSEITNDIFTEYDATIVNFWTNGCGSCIAEMPDLEQFYQDLQEKNINLIAVAASAGDSEQARSEAEGILKEKGVTYINIIPDNESDFYKDFIGEITGFPTTYLVDSEGNMIGAPIVGVVKNQEEALMKRLDEIVAG